MSVYTVVVLKNGVEVFNREEVVVAGELDGEYLCQAEAEEIHEMALADMLGLDLFPGDAHLSRAGVWGDLPQ